MTEDYYTRNLLLRKIGFRSYRGYLKSDLWKLIRTNVLYRDTCSCCVPGCRISAARQVHHLDYSIPTLLGLAPFNLVTLCRDHHEECEYRGKAKLNLTDSRIKTLSLLIPLPQKQSRGEKYSQWFYTHYQYSQSTAKRIWQQMPITCPNWHIIAMDGLRSGQIPVSFKEYLGLTREKQ